MREKVPTLVTVSVRMSAELKSALEAEAWEEQRSLSDYIQRLLQHRGKWARSVGTAGGYDIGSP